MKYVKHGHGKWIVDPKEYQDQVINAVIEMVANDNSILLPYGLPIGRKVGL